MVNVALSRVVWRWQQFRVKVDILVKLVNIRRDMMIARNVTNNLIAIINAVIESVVDDVTAADDPSSDYYP